MKKIFTTISIFLLVISIVSAAIGDTNSVSVENSVQQQEQEDQDQDQEEQQEDQEQEDQEQEEQQEDQEQEDQDQDQEEVDIKHDKDEIKAFNNGQGAKIRLLQLQKRILRNIYVGEKAIDYIEDENISIEARAILEEMNILLEQVQDYTFEDKDKEILVEDFLAYKAQAIDLTRRFRELVRAEITADEAAEVKAAGPELAEIEKQIRYQIRDRNAEQLRQHMQLMGIEDEGLIEDVRYGMITAQQAKADVIQRWKDMEPGKKRQTAQKARQEVKRSEDFYENVRKSVAKLSERRLVQSRQATENIERLRQKLHSGEMEIDTIGSRIAQHKERMIEVTRQGLNQEAISRYETIREEEAQRTMSNRQNTARQRISAQRRAAMQNPPTPPGDSQ